MTPEDEKLIILARAALARGGWESAGAARDETGRTHVAGEIDLPHLRLTALAAVVAVAVASGARGIEAVAVAGAGLGSALERGSGSPSSGLELTDIDVGSLTILADLALPDCVVFSCDRSGRVIGEVEVSADPDQDGP